jgi:hypothetical protein
MEGTLTTHVSFFNASNAQHADKWRADQDCSLAPQAVRTCEAYAQHGLDFDDIPDTLPSRRDVETGAITEAEVSATGWVS